MGTREMLKQKPLAQQNSRLYTFRQEKMDEILVAAEKLLRDSTGMYSYT